MSDWYPFDGDIIRNIYPPGNQIPSPEGTHSTFRTIAPRYRSKQAILDYLGAPTGKIINDYVLQSTVMSGYDPGITGVGSQAHGAIEYGLKRVRESRAALASRPLSPTDIDAILARAVTAAETRLHIDGALMKKAFVTDIIELIGRRYLENTKDEFFIEKQVQSTRIHEGHTVGTTMDLIYFDSDSNTVKVYDWKSDPNALPRESLHIAPETKISAVIASDTSKHLFGDRINDNTRYEVIYGIKRSVAETIPRLTGTEHAEIVNIPVDSATIEDFRGDLRQISTNIDTIQSSVEMALRNPVKGALTDVMARMVADGKCSPDSPARCRTCAARFICPVSRVTDDVIRGNENAPHTSIDRVKRSLKRAMEKDFSPSGDIGEIVGNASSWEVEYMVQNVMRREYEQREYTLSRGLEFRDRDATRTGKLPFDILSPKFRPSWLPPHMHETLRRLVSSHIDVLADTSGSYMSSLARQAVRTGIGKDTVFQERLHGIINRSAASILHDQGIDLHDIDSPENRRYLSLAYRMHDDKTISSLVSMVRSHIEERFTDSILTHDNGYVAKHVPEDIRREFANDTVRRYLQGTVKRRAEEVSGPGEWIEEFKKGMSTSSTVERFRLGGSRRIPVGGVGSTFLLSYIGATLTARRRAETAMEKAIDATTSDDRVDNGAHNATMTVAMRLLSSDFGSAARKGFRVSDRLAQWHMNSMKTLADLKDAISTGIAEIANAGRPEYDPTPLTERAIEVARSMKGWGIRAAPVVLAAAGITAALIGIGGLFTSPGDKEVVEETRYKRALRRSRLAKTDQTRLVEDESDTRKNQLRHTPYAFSVIPAILQAPLWRIFSGASELAASMAKGTMSRLAKLTGSGEFTAMASDMAVSGRVARLAAENAGEPERVVARTAASAISEIRQGISASKNRVAATLRRRAATRWGYEATADGAAIDRGVRRRLNRSVESVLTTNPISVPSPVTVVPSRESLPVTDAIIHRTPRGMAHGIITESGRASTPVHRRLGDLESISSVSGRYPGFVPAYRMKTPDLTRISTPMVMDAGTGIASLALSESPGTITIPRAPEMYHPPANRQLPTANPSDYMSNYRLPGGRSAKASVRYPGFAPLSKDYRG